MTEHEARRRRHAHFKGLTHRRVCLRCQNIVSRFRFHDGCCDGCVTEIAELSLRDDPWAFKVDWDHPDLVAVA
jgi:hypothetical protein